ncbi:MAG: nucleoside triphosphate pyrophosphohydrolase [Candidatus Colwellbacteria bacterium]|nr:nucleoside triphosphate pyrophosphohydrolase [Candidatus Colwellbacteria bacterium]
MKYNKLVRDKVPEIITSKGEACMTHIASDAEYWEKLTEKLVEEAGEFREGGTIEELSDVLEVADAIANYKGFDQAMIRDIRDRKIAEKGGFSGRIILDES